MKPFTIMNQSTLINWIVSRFLIATTFLSAPALLAATETLDDPKDSKSVPPAEIKPWCETPAVRNPHRCSWVLLGVSGNSGVKGVVASPDISFDEIFDHLTHVPLVLSVDIRYKRWEFFGDGMYMDVGASAPLPGLLFTNANIHLQVGLAEGFRRLSSDQLR